MTVGDLIRELQKWPADATVEMGGDTSYHDGIDLGAELDSRRYEVGHVHAVADDDGSNILVLLGGRILGLTRIPRGAS